MVLWPHRVEYFGGKVTVALHHAFVPDGEK